MLVKSVDTVEPAPLIFNTPLEPAPLPTYALQRCPAAHAAVASTTAPFTTEREPTPQLPTSSRLLPVVEVPPSVTRVPGPDMVTEPAPVPLLPKVSASASSTPPLVTKS